MSLGSRFLFFRFPDIRAESGGHERKTLAENGGVEVELEPDGVLGIW